MSCEQADGGARRTWPTCLDVSRQTVNAIETGRYDPSLPLAFKIAAVFDQPLESLFFATQDHPTSSPRCPCRNALSRVKIGGGRLPTSMLLGL